MSAYENILYLFIVILLLAFVDLLFLIISLKSKKSSIEYKIEIISNLLSKGKIQKADMLIDEIENEKIIEKYKAELLYKRIFSSHLVSDEDKKNKYFNDFINYISANEISLDIKDRAIENLLDILDKEQKMQLNKFIFE